MKDDYYEYDAVVTKVLDGDTVEVRVDLGFDPVHTTKRLRLLNVYAPEVKGRSKAKGFRAKAHLEGLTMDREVLVWTYLNRNKRYRKTFDRYVATVWLPGDPVSVNDQMVNSGHAKRTAS